VSGRIGAEQLRWHRMKASGLARSFPSTVAAAHALVGIQAQLLPAAGIALWNRTPYLTSSLFAQITSGRRHLVSKRINTHN
jgi:hypothetical protein